MFKTCGTCKQSLPLSEFYLLSRGNYRSQCKACCRAAVSVWFQANKARRAAYLRDYRAL